MNDVARSDGVRPSGSLTVAAGQFAPGSDTAANLAAIGEIARRARELGAGLLVLPEYASYSTRVLDERVLEYAEDVDGPFATEIRSLARELGIAVVVGMFERITGASRVYNAVLLVDPDGVLVGVYRKTHLYDAFGQRESTWIAPGPLDVPETMTVDGVSVGVQTCYDLRFPEVTRRLADAGAEIVVVPAQWAPGPAKVRHWTTLLAARAIENTLYVVGVDQAAPNGCGTSMIISPAGEALAELGTEPGLAVASVDVDLIVNVRAANPSLAARRFAVVPASREHTTGRCSIESPEIDPKVAEVPGGVVGLDNESRIDQYYFLGTCHACGERISHESVGREDGGDDDAISCSL